MDGIEIDIRRSNKTTPGRSTSVTHRIGDYERKIVSEEKVKLSQAHWDYSALHGKKILKCLHNYNIQLLVNIYTLKKFLLILFLHRRKIVPIIIVFISVLSLFSYMHNALDSSCAHHVHVTCQHELSVVYEIKFFLIHVLREDIIW
jgi:hypothetical protein